VTECAAAMVKGITSCSGTVCFYLVSDIRTFITQDETHLFLFYPKSNVVVYEGILARYSDFYAGSTERTWLGVC
jgi:hypothetical protein